MCDVALVKIIRIRTRQLTHLSGKPYFTILIACAVCPTVLGFGQSLEGNQRLVLKKEFLAGRSCSFFCFQIVWRDLPCDHIDVFKQLVHLTRARFCLELCVQACEACFGLYMGRGFWIVLRALCVWDACGTLPAVLWSAFICNVSLKSTEWREEWVGGFSASSHCRTSQGVLLNWSHYFINTNHCAA